MPKLLQSLFCAQGLHNAPHLGTHSAKTSPPLELMLAQAKPVGQLSTHLPAHSLPSGVSMQKLVSQSAFSEHEQFAGAGVPVHDGVAPVASASGGPRPTPWPSAGVASVAMSKPLFWLPLSVWLTSGLPK